MSGSSDERRRSTRAGRAATHRERRHVARRAAAADREERQRLARAKQAWGRLSSTAQFELVCELVETRSDELKRAYTGVLSIAPGHSRYRRAGAQRTSVGHEPAVTFLVERKWASKRKAPRSGAIPSRLFAYASIEGRRELCAVPTDVEDAREYRLRAQAGSYVLVTPPPALAGIETSAGAITCVIRTEAGSSTVYLLSCRHVFGMTASTSQHPTGAVVTRDDGSGSPTGPVLARTDNIYGPLSSGSNHNFDVAFARLEVAESALSEILDRLAPVSGLRYVDGHTEIAQLKEYVILSPGGDKEATYVRGWPAAGQPTVEYERIGPLSQGVLVIELSVAGKGTIAGDSGSPVVTTDRTRLVGMHFAGSQQKAYMIPAYELVKRKNYVGFADGEPFVID